MTRERRAHPFNGEERVLAAGLQVRSLLSEAQAHAVPRGELAVLDARGRERGLDGALLDGRGCAWCRARAP